MTDQNDCHHAIKLPSVKINLVLLWLRIQCLNAYSVWQTLYVTVQ